MPFKTVQSEKLSGAVVRQVEELNALVCRVPHCAMPLARSKTAAY